MRANLMIVICTMAIAACGRPSADSDLAATSANGSLISCRADGRYDCSFTEPYIDGRRVYPAEMAMKVDYFYKCGGVDSQNDYQVGIISETDKAKQLFVWQTKNGADWKRSLTITGRGPFRFVDFDKEWTKSLTGIPGCDIRIVKAHVPDVSPQTQKAAGAALGDALIFQTTFEALKGQAQLLSVLQSQIERLDVSSLKSALDPIANQISATAKRVDGKIKSKGDRDLIHRELNSIQRKLELVRSLEPALDPEAPPQIDPGNVLAQLIEDNDRLVKAFADQVALRQVQVAEMLAFAQSSTKARIYADQADGLAALIQEYERQLPWLDAPARARLKADLGKVASGLKGITTPKIKAIANQISIIQGKI